MGYKEYVESCIMESGLDETVELLEILEGAETMEDVEAVEEYLTEKGKGSVKDALSKLNPANAYKGARNKVAAKSAHKSVAGVTFDNGDAYADAYNAKFSKTCDVIDKGSIAAGATLLLAATAGAGLAIRSKIKKANSAPAKQIEKKTKELEKQAQDVAKRCKAGEITAKEAKVETKKIEAQLKKLAKDAAKIAATEEKETNESVDITNLQLEIFEACESGNITEDDRDELLELLND